MKNTARLTLACLLILQSGCATVKTSGAQFYPEGQLNELTAILDKGINRPIQQELRKIIVGDPEVFANKDSEKWVYKFSHAVSKIKSHLTYAERTEKTAIHNLELIFDKRGVLKSYHLTRQNHIGNERNPYINQLGQGLITGLIGAMTYLIINEIRIAVTNK